MERNKRGISRRTFLKGSAAAAAVAAVASMTGCSDPTQGTTAGTTEGTLEEVPTTSAGNAEPAPLPEDEIYVTQRVYMTIEIYVAINHRTRHGI